CCSVFCFQAEDGIRDDLVTGVQTCALPISDGDCHAGSAAGAICAWTADPRTAVHAHIAPAAEPAWQSPSDPCSQVTPRCASNSRSEERRVGTEWRYQCVQV